MQNLVYHGDCLEIMDNLIEQGVVVDAIITDPPYWITACKWDSVIPFDKMWERLNKLIKPNWAIVLFWSEPFSSALRMSNIKNYKYDWYWKKNKKTNFANVKRQPLRDNECISIFSKRQAVYNPQWIIRIDKKCNRNKPKNETINAGENDWSLCWEYIQEFTGYPSQSLEFKVQSKTVHPTQKPVALMEYLVKTYTHEGEMVLDFTAGSWSTWVACKNTSRWYILIEKEKEYIDIIYERLGLCK